MKSKETHNSSKKWRLNLWWISNKTIMEVKNITRAATFKSFLHLSYENTQLLFFVMRKTLTDYFWWLHKNMNCAFPLNWQVFFTWILVKSRNLPFGSKSPCDQWFQNIFIKTFSLDVLVSKRTSTVFCWSWHICVLKSLL